MKCEAATTPRHTAPHRITPHHTAPHRTTPHRIASHRIASHRIASHRGKLLAPHDVSLGLGTLTTHRIQVHNALLLDEDGGENPVHLAKRATRTQLRQDEPQ
jgi:hypothetical protein